MTYSEKLRDPRWQKKRLKILERDNFTCQFCRDKETELHIHHLEYLMNPWDVEDESLVTLCKDCHSHIKMLNDFTGFNFVDKILINGNPNPVYTIWFNDYVVVVFDESEQIKLSHKFITKAFKILNKTAQNG